MNYSRLVSRRRAVNNREIVNFHCLFHKKGFHPNGRMTNDSSANVSGVNIAVQ